MDKKFIEMLKQDLAKAVKEKNLARIKEIRDLLNISSEYNFIEMLVYINLRCKRE